MQNLLFNSGELKKFGGGFAVFNLYCLWAKNLMVLKCNFNTHGHC